jgi:hypothetical protein
MGLFSPSSQNPLGLHPGRQERVRVKMRNSAGTQGMVCYFDLAASDGEVTASTNFGAATNPTANVITSTASQDGDEVASVIWLHCVLNEAIAENAEGWATIRGVVRALGGATTAAGVGLAPTTGGELLQATVNTRVIGVALEALANATLGWVAFNGIEGFGSAAAATA